jgi:hypothetical protein
MNICYLLTKPVMMMGQRLSDYETSSTETKQAFPIPYNTKTVFSSDSEMLSTSFFTVSAARRQPGTPMLSTEIPRTFALRGHLNGGVAAAGDDDLDLVLPSDIFANVLGELCQCPWRFCQCPWRFRIIRCNRSSFTTNQLTSIKPTQTGFIRSK